MHNVVIPDDFPSVIADSAALTRLKMLPDTSVKVHVSQPSGESGLASRIVKANTVLISRSVSLLTPAVVASAHNLQHVILLGATSEETDPRLAAIHHVRFTYASSGPNDSVAEHTLALMLALAHKVPELDQRVRSGEWPRGLITQLSGKTLGIVGTGRSGGRLAHLARGIGMGVVVCQQPEPSGQGAEKNKSELAELLAAADVVSMHAHVAGSPTGLFSARHFAMMKASALFVSAERHGLVDERALASALTTQVISGAALDVFDQEPLPRDSALLYLPSVILSPHTGGLTPESVDASLDTAINSAAEYIRGKR